MSEFASPRPRVRRAEHRRMRVRNGHIVESRDYHDHAGLGGAVRGD